MDMIESSPAGKSGDDATRRSGRARLVLPAAAVVVALAVAGWVALGSGSEPDVEADEAAGPSAPSNDDAATEDAEFAATVDDAVRTVLIEFHDIANETGNHCAHVEQWTEKLDAAFEAEGLGVWSYESVQVAPENHCYEIASIQTDERRIEFVGVAGEFSIGCDPREC